MAFECLSAALINTYSDYLCEVTACVNIPHMNAASQSGLCWHGALTSKNTQSTNQHHVCEHRCHGLHLPSVCACAHRRSVFMCSTRVKPVIAQHVLNTPPSVLCICCFVHVCDWRAARPRAWPLTWASSTLHPPTGCQCLKWGGHDMTALESQWSLCALIASQMSSVDVGQWEGLSDRPGLLVGVHHCRKAGSDDLVPACNKTQ